MRMPPLTAADDWSVCVRDADDDRVLVDHWPERLLRTASVGKLFLLAEIDRQWETGRLDPCEQLAWHDEELLADSGL
ncbi:hypothetical protein HJ590_01870 [Naumannella sp. ID2617S]|nr:hypothetical protein [Naumannella sp. ID2617S]